MLDEVRAALQLRRRAQHVDEQLPVAQRHVAAAQQAVLGHGLERGQQVVDVAVAGDDRSGRLAIALEERIGRGRQPFGHRIEHLDEELLDDTEVDDRGVVVKSFTVCKVSALPRAT